MWVDLKSALLFAVMVAFFVDAWFVRRQNAEASRNAGALELFANTIDGLREDLARGNPGTVEEVHARIRLIDAAIVALTKAS
jgi:hypothetical protein